MNLSDKKILLIGYNFWPEPTGIGKYSGEMIEWLAKNGAQCTVITSYPYYPYWRIQPPYRSKRFFYSTERKNIGTGSIRILRCPVYIPKNPSGLKRMFQDATFFLSSTAAVKYIALTRARHQITLAISPSFFVGFPALIYRLLRRNKVLYHIQDLQIEAAEQLGMIKSPILLSTLYRLEKYILKRVNAVSTISEAMAKKVEEKSQEKVHLIPNWSDTEFFRPIQNKSELKKEFGFDSNKKVVLYSGAIGKKQGLEMILNAAETFSESGTQFVICGTGPYSEIIQKKALERTIQNLCFLPLQPLEQFNRFLNMADVHLVIQKSGASDLLLPSKLTNIFSVGGLALITATKGTFLYQLNEDHNLAVVVEPENQEAFNEGLKETLLLRSKNDERIMNARSYAEKYLNKNSVMSLLSNVFKGL